MAAKKGNNHGGNRKGIQNKTTTQAKDIILKCITNQSAFVDETLETVRFSDPVEWLKIMTKLIQFVMPKQVDVISDGKSIAPKIIMNGSIGKPVA